MPLTAREQELMRLLDPNVLGHASASLTPAETWRQVRQSLLPLARFAERISQQ